MLSFKNLQSIKTINLSKTLFMLLVLLPITFPAIASSESHSCQRDVVQLRGNLNVVMSRGGLWALMEQTEGLQDESTIGFQLDGKLSRAVSRFESLCESEKKPTKQLFVRITNLLGKARVIWNPTTSGEAIVKSITDLNKKLDSLLLKMK